MFAAGFKGTSGGKTRAASENAALGAIADVARLVAGFTPPQMAERRLSGTHLWRHVGSEITTRVSWPEFEANVVGDWKTSGGSAEPAKKGKRAKAGVASTVRGTYSPDATADQEVEVRHRYLRLVRAAFKRGRERFPCQDHSVEFEGRSGSGKDRIARGTTWSDLFPPVPPPALAEFYGALFEYAPGGTGTPVGPGRGCGAPPNPVGAAS